VASLVILFALCIAVAIVYRLVAGSNRDDADHSDSLPKQPATRSRPLGHRGASRRRA
jgi:hypothetical protein